MSLHVELVCAKGADMDARMISGQDFDAPSVTLFTFTNDSILIGSRHIDSKECRNMLSIACIQECFFTRSYLLGVSLLSAVTC